MVSRWSALLAVVLLASALDGCGGSNSDDGSAAAADAASAIPSDLSDAASGDADLDGQADEGAGLTAEEFCGFITREAPEVVDLQPAEYAAATFGGALIAFYSEKGLITDIGASEMDALAAEGCPDESAAVLEAMGVGSFADVP